MRRLDPLDDLRRDLTDLDGVVALDGRLNDEEHSVDLVDRRQRCLDHELVQRAFGAVDAGRVEKGDLKVGFAEDAENTVSRRLRLGGDDGQLLADEAVEKCRLADVGTTDEGDDAGAVFGGVHGAPREAGGDPIRALAGSRWWRAARSMTAALETAGPHRGRSAGSYSGVGRGLLSASGLLADHD